MQHLPDLLFDEPRLRVNANALQQAFNYAFTTGKFGKAMDEALRAATWPETTWQPDFFHKELFLASFVAENLTLAYQGARYQPHGRFLQAVFHHPPQDLATIQFRQSLMRECDTNESVYRDAFALYDRLTRLMEMFTREQPSFRADMTEFRMGLLKQIQAVIDFMAGAFQTTETPWRRIREAGAATQQSEDYEKLCELVDFEDHLTTMTLAVKLSADGRVRAFRVLDVRDNVDNPHYATLMDRYKARWQVFAKGYRLSKEELAGRLIDHVFEQLEPTLVPLVQLLGHLEFYLAGVSFARSARTRGLSVCLADFPEPGNGWQLDQLFNPLLFQQKLVPVPCDVGVEDNGRIVLVTGPNSGGKTRLLQAVGLAQVLGQCGFFVPAASAHLGLCPGIFASLIQGDTSQQKEGRLGTELKRIRALFEQGQPGSLVILDELCSGTNPAEGIEIFEMVLNLLRKINAPVLISSHFLDYMRELARRTDTGLVFLQAELGAGGEPTYQFVPGVADHSLARRTAERLGVTFEELSALIQRHGS